MSDDNRLARMESKLDDLQKAVVTLARIEERTLTIFNRTEKIEGRVSELEHKTDKIKEKAGTAWVERLFWIVVMTAVGIAASVL